MSSTEHFPGSIDRTKYEAAYSYDRLSRFPEDQPEALADHYLSMCAYAQQLRHIVRSRLYAPSRGEEIDKAINRIAEKMKAAHLHDLGIALEWPINDPR